MIGVLYRPIIGRAIKLIDRYQNHSTADALLQKQIDQCSMKEKINFYLSALLTKKNLQSIQNRF